MISAADLHELNPLNANTVDPGALRAELCREGCLLLRQLVGPALLQPLADDVAAVLIRQGVAERVADELIWNGNPVGKRHDRLALYDVPAFHDLIRQIEQADGPLQRAGDLVLGRRSHVRRSVYLFATFPDDAAFVTRPHQDGVRTGAEPHEQVRIWLPLFPIDFGDGGLGFAPGTHRCGYLPEDLLTEYRTRVGPGNQQSDTTVHGIDLAGLGDVKLRTAAMKPGDACVFDRYTVHFGVPATSRRIRLAVAIELVGAEAPAKGSFHLAEMKERSREVQAVARASGFDEEAGVAALVDLNIAGLMTTPENIRAALAGTYGGWREEQKPVAALATRH